MVPHFVVKSIVVAIVIPLMVAEDNAMAVTLPTVNRVVPTIRVRARLLPVVMNILHVSVQVVQVPEIPTGYAILRTLILRKCITHVRLFL
jgi:hypothetical protein